MVNSLALAGVAIGCCSTDSVEEVTRDVLTIIIATTIIITIIKVTGVALTTLASVLAVIGLLSTALIVTVL